MKRTILSLFVLGSLSLTARADETTNASASVVPPAASIATPDADAAPGEGFAPRRYESLWIKSPFAVETPEAAEESPDYSLVGVAQLDGVFYATLIQRQNQDHFVLSSDKPIRGLSLTTVNFGHGAMPDTTVALVKDGQPISLKLEAPSQGTPQPLGAVNENAQAIAAPTFMQPNIRMPGANPPAGTPPIRPLIRIHRSAIHLPPRVEQPAPAPAPPANPPPPAQ